MNFFLIAGWHCVLHRYKSIGINWAFSVSQEGLKNNLKFSYCFSQHKLSHHQWWCVFSLNFFCSKRRAALYHFVISPTIWKEVQVRNFSHFLHSICVALLWIRSLFFSSVRNNNLASFEKTWFRSKISQYIK